MKEISNIHAHSMYSFQDGVATPEEVIIAAKEKGLRSIAITEHGHMHSQADWMIAAKKHDVKGMYGVEAYCIHDLNEWNGLREKLSAEKKEAGKLTASEEDGEFDLEKAAEKNKENRRLLNRKGHMVMVAQNREGLANLYNLVHLSHRDGFYKKPRMDKAMVATNSAGIIASSACMGGVISNKLWQMQRGEATIEDAITEACEWNEIFGKGKFFLEVQSNEHEGQRFINQGIIDVHKATGIPLIATMDSHYTDPEDWKTQEILHMLLTNRGKSGVTMATKPDTYNFKVRSLFVKSAEELYESFIKNNPEVSIELLDQAFDNTLLADSLVDRFEPDTTQRLPSLPFSDTFKELGERSLKGLLERGLNKDERYVERLLYELKMIQDKGISNYFLVVNQIVEETRKRQLIGPGRGSAGGSLVCYLLGITNIDPLEHNLMFERFINVDRIEVPDIDLDFQDVDGVKDVLREIFGSDNVACISTYGTNQIKGVMKDVCRVFDIDHKEANKANAKIEKELHVMYQQGEAKSAVIIKLDDVYKYSPTFKAFIKEHPEIEEPIKRIYGKVHHVGRHASGVVIGDNLPRETAIFTSKGILQTSFTDGVVNKNLSAMGLVKFDILGLATLNIIDAACQLISQRKNISLEDAFALVDPKKMDLNDQKIMKTVFHDGSMTGIFQMTSHGMRKMVQRIKPDCFADVAACGALYRPGPLGSGMDKLYAGNKIKAQNGELEYDHPILGEILKETYGCFVYQEHILELGRRLGKLSWKDTNRLRKLFLKRTKDAASGRDDEAEELKGKLIAGFIENGLSQEYGEKTWKELEAWASYGFNAAHAKAYGMVTMQTAFLRTYYPLEFFAAVLMKGQASDLQSYVNEMRKQGYEVRPVEVNKSKLFHSIEDDSVRLSFSAVLGVGESAVKKIVSNQPYESLIDFMFRSGANKGVCESLIKIDAFREIEPESSIKTNLARHAVFYGNPKLKQKKNWDELQTLYAEAWGGDDDPVELIESERELLGFNIRSSAFTINGRDKKTDDLISEGLAIELTDLLNEDGEHYTDEVACLVMAVKDIKERPQKNKQMFAFLKLADRNGQEIEVPCFGNIWQHVSSKVLKGGVYVFVLHRKEDDPTGFIVGKPGWKHSADNARSYVIPLDLLEI